MSSAKGIYYYMSSEKQNSSELLLAQDWGKGDWKGLKMVRSLGRIQTKSQITQKWCPENVHESSISPLLLKIFENILFPCK